MSPFILFTTVVERSLNTFATRSALRAFAVGVLSLVLLCAIVDGAEAAMEEMRRAAFECVARACGFADSTIHDLVERGEWRRWFDGPVFSAAGTPVTHLTRVSAARLRVGTDAVVAARSAARLWGLPGFEVSEALEFAVPRGHTPTCSGITAACTEAGVALLEETKEVLRAIGTTVGNWFGLDLDASVDAWRGSLGGPDIRGREA